MSEKIDIVRSQSDKRLSRFVQYGDLVFLSGITAGEAGSDIQSQTRKVLEKMDGFLAQAGTDKTRLLSVQIWLRDVERDIEGMNEVWNVWTDGAPTRACGEARMADPKVLVEMIAIAARG